MVCDVATNLDAMHDIFTVNEVADLVDKLEQLANAMRPLIEQLSRVLTWRERHQTCRSVDLCPHVLVHNHVAEVLLGLLFAQRQQESEPLHANVRVVASHHSNVLRERVRLGGRKVNRKRTCSVTRCWKASQSICD